jgi:hypothetical protein
MTEKLGFGYVSDNDESLQTKTGGRFGLNQAFITVFEYNPTAGADGAAADAVDITVMVEQKEFRRRIYDITGDLYNKNNEKVSPDQEGYAELYNAELKQRMAVVTHAAKALGVTDDQIKTALATPPSSFAAWAKIMTSLPSDNFRTKPVDVFLEWEWQIGEGNTQTFLILAKNMKGGRFLCPHVKPQGAWTAKNEKGLTYVDAAGNEHPFTRSEDYMKSNKAKQQKEGQEDAPSGGMNNNTDDLPFKENGAAAKKSTW